MDIISTIALITINETLVVQLASFLIFLFLINRIMLRPLKNTMNEREGYLEQIRLEIAAATEKLGGMTKDLQAREVEAKAEAFLVQEELEESGKKNAAEILAAAREQILHKKTEVEEQIENQLTEARKHVKEEAETLAVNIMEKVLDRRLFP
jgi:F-type H+-transporting ATPase subunit b